MEIKILFFGITKEQTETENSVLTIAKENIKLEKLKTVLQKKYPNLKDLDTYAFAINEEYATNDSILKNKDVVAVIPPVSGG